MPNPGSDLTNRIPSSLLDVIHPGLFDHATSNKDFRIKYLSWSIYIYNIDTSISTYSDTQLAQTMQQEFHSNMVARLFN